MKVDLLKLTRLNRIAVCGRCKHQFDVSVHLGWVSEDDGLVPQSSPIRLTPSHIPLIESPPPPVSESVPPTSGPYRAADEHSPPPFSRPKRRTSPASGWPQSEAPASPGDAKWPGAARPRLGWSKRRSSPDRDTQPSLPRADHDTEPASTPPAFDLELHLPNVSADSPEEGRRGTKKSSLVREKRKEIVVEVGDRKSKRRRRNTYSPESLVTEPAMNAPKVEGDEER